ncbi:hypothetical protein FD13_GL000303 [Levilactobacillus senmaizukei DSM 21775 = NBRC 103853]|uniref:Uncharacterized protein n=1 Tax=Levilactobacillus senmaizukei DSM 21775 = NBRC 103853 TaxID=1423803 RepID=A0A0R2DFS7_9LACO|nr:hypothetical protein [Levilactobacillus senmaizukei]KRN02163.1 hypothetical protein FD13_GL000303 [Levilactobacillus senmaizukei DSM 21775 = NBRC 103853]
MKKYGLIDSIAQGRKLTFDQYLMYEDLLHDLELEELFLMNHAIAMSFGGDKKEGGPNGGIPEV